MFTTPILFLIFNRPDTTLKVFERIREVKPKQLFIAADGPRKGNKHDEFNCELVREVVNYVDWDCKIKTLFRNENLGCGKGVSQSITWFFENVEEGIILEDDCLPNTSFFNFCQEMLKKFRDKEAIFHISGSNYQFGRWRGDGDYYFSKLPHIWGWATWKRAWNYYDYDISGEDFLVSKAYPRKKDINLRQFWKDNLKDFKLNNIDTWDYQWLLTCWKYEGITIIPNKNLIINEGFGRDATHTNLYPNYYRRIKQESLVAPYKHPENIMINYKADSYEAKIRSGKQSILLIFLIKIKKFLNNLK